MLKAIKIRLYPNNSQEIYINRLLGCYRLVFNLCLNKKIEEYNTNRKSLSLSDLSKYFHNELTKDGNRDFLNEHNTKILKQSILNLEEAYKRFFVNGDGFPKFKSRKKNKQSARFPLEAFSRKNEFLDGKITLTKQLKELKFECSEEYKTYLNKNKSGIKSATLSKTKSGKYLLSILIDGDVNKILPKPKNEIIGLDLGIKSFIVDSKGNEFKNLKLTRNNQKRIARLQKQLSKKKDGSNNKEKQRKKLAVFHEKLNNKKLNYLHEITSQLVRDNQTIVIEDLNVSGMLKNHHLACSIQELSIGEFVRQLEYKTQWYGRDLVKIDRYFPSSKLCSDCGHKNNFLSLKEREWKCLNCGVIHNRDYNAAINIEREGERIIKIGHRLPELTSVEIGNADDPSRNTSLKSTQSKLKKKQKDSTCTILSKFR